MVGYILNSLLKYKTGRTKKIILRDQMHIILLFSRNTSVTSGAGITYPSGQPADFTLDFI